MQKNLKKLKHKALMKTVALVKKSRQESLSEVCALFDLKRDAYYKYIKRYETKLEQE